MSVLITWNSYFGSVIGYVLQMLPCMLAGAGVFFCLRPIGKRRLCRLGLSSGPMREAALALFAVFCAGLAALTLFPANFWSYILQYLFSTDVRAEGFHLAQFYLSKEELVLRITGLKEILAPFQEIRRALRHGSWLMFMLWGNIAMFLPIGFFSALLWRKNRWWKSCLIGCGCSVLVEFVQFFIGRSTDIDDVILNTTGAVMGYWLFIIVKLLAPQMAAEFRCKEREEGS